MYNFIAKFGEILDIFKEFARKRVIETGNVPRRGVVTNRSLPYRTAETFRFDNENHLFKRCEVEKGDLLPNLITRHQYNQRRKQTSKLGKEIRKDIAAAMDKEERKCSASTSNPSRYSIKFSSLFSNITESWQKQTSAHRRKMSPIREHIRLVNIDSTQD